MVKAFWKYRWLSAYLVSPSMIDKWIEGDRGMALRADLTAIDCMVSDSITTLWNEIRADSRFGENEVDGHHRRVFDYTLPKAPYTASPATTASTSSSTRRSWCRS